MYSRIRALCISVLLAGCEVAQGVEFTQEMKAKKEVKPMDVRRILKRSETMVGAVRDCRKVLASMRAVKRWGSLSISKRYLASAQIKKLQIGAGQNSLKGWLSADISPASQDTMYLDATQRFPFATQTFDYIYSEHMIEHISWKDGIGMLKECHRVLKPGGTLRVATPDLAVMIGLYARQDELAKRYIAWITDNFLPDVQVHNPVFVINNAFHDWGHQFLYDAETMEGTMRLAGFTSVHRCTPGQSDDPHLAGIESHGAAANAREMGDFETMVLEAKDGPNPKV
jgi:predicted SAM-dependent methyltransferase